ncbi:hypothetical protein EDEG_02247 [Edhazardia aedis USNM 41457]|uniref:Uncharacterized protein n=1 Tax=Edhazardia aedis (strain USNM 41457) TaxID=1003232 RepID=J9DLC0_EDHAE|nr:hypothetical protein EDEG_02247 [Edhazardia aedis USNM 41457]|eukprot:EJW03390.1 hypothetical protein EDEG_02247 [Edhazardia aedis USNM 41457]
MSDAPTGNFIPHLLFDIPSFLILIFIFTSFVFHSYNFVFLVVLCCHLICLLYIILITFPFRNLKLCRYHQYAALHYHTINSKFEFCTCHFCLISSATIVSI